MAYSETHPVRFQGGIHNGSLAPLVPFSQHGLRLSGYDPGDYDAWQDIMMEHRPENEVQISADSGDPQTDRDLVTIAKHTIWNGRDLWPGRQIPPERFNQGANFLRASEGLPQEGPMQVPPDKVKPAPYLQQQTASVKAESMDRKSDKSTEDLGGPIGTGVRDTGNANEYEDLGGPIGTGVKKVKTEEGVGNTVGPDFPNDRHLPDDEATQKGEEAEGDYPRKSSLDRTAEKDEKWIQKAVKRPGQLHKDLGVPEGEKIPEEKLEEALHSDDPKERERAQFAENMKGVGKGKKGAYDRPTQAEEVDEKIEEDEEGEKKKESSFVKEAPGSEHMKGVSPKRNRQYEHIKEQYIADGKSEEEAKELAARTVNKERAEKGETKEGSDTGDTPENDNNRHCPNCDAILQNNIGYDECPQCHESLSKSSMKIGKWEVVALGEMQQPSAVGGGEGYNEVVDGPNPEGMDVDNAQNSRTQEVGLETWVNMAVDMLNRQESPDAILAQLAHDGCPDPQAILERAQQQGQQTPISDEIGQDPFEAPVPDDGMTPGQQSVNRQPPVMAHKVRVAGTDMIGEVVERYEDLWGQGSVRIALDDGGSVTVAPDKIEDASVEAPAPASQTIQEYIDSLPAVEPSRPHIEARIANLREAKFECMRALKTASFHEQIELDRIALAADEEMSALKLWLSSDEALPNVSLVAQSYEINKFLPELAVTDRIFEGRVAEAAAIFAHETPYSVEGDALEAAVIYAQNHNMSAEQTNEFLAGVRDGLATKTTPAVEKTAATTTEDSDGPAEALFI